MLGAALVCAWLPLSILGCKSEIANVGSCSGSGECLAAGTSTPGRMGGAGASSGQASTSAGVGGRPVAPAAAGNSAAAGGGAGGDSASKPRSGAGTGGAPVAGAEAAGMGGAAAADTFESARKTCVDTINMYRATRGLAALRRGTPEQEACMDKGAKKDGDSGKPHSSASDCRSLGLPGAQNACPGYPVRNGSTVDVALQGCLKQMWDEGEPSEGVRACIADSSGCFQMHGHWINMTDTNSGVVACGFYRMTNGSYWMNQNFGP